MKRTLPKRSGSKGAAPAQVPKLLIKGGIEVLEIRTGADSITTIELFLNPRTGTPSEHEFGYSANITVATTDTADKPKIDELPCFSVGKVKLPLLNDDMTGDKILMWEAVSCKTEVIGAGSLCNVHSFRKRVDNGSYTAAQPIVGLNYHMFAVGGEPLQLQFLTENYQTSYKDSYAAPKVPLTGLAQVLDPRLKGILDKDGYYPVECWHPDPAKNENSRYFGTYTGGVQTPPVLQFSNSLTTILLDENGVGPLCKGDNLFLSCCDVVGFKYESGGTMKFRGLPRYFSVTLRKRQVKNPYPVGTLLNSLFNKLAPDVDSQPMTGEHSQVEEVRVYQGTEVLPGDPDLQRYVDQYGQKETRPPQDTERNLLLEINKLKARLQYVRQKRPDPPQIMYTPFPYVERNGRHVVIPTPDGGLTGHIEGIIETEEISEAPPPPSPSSAPLPPPTPTATPIVLPHPTVELTGHPVTEEDNESPSDGDPSHATTSNVIEFTMDTAS
ncbi:VP1 [Meles meles polyomavirus 1]|uniref:Major capsid protein VP1 n=1 Tax=Meles meles polyomavirus 1 TaxID=1608323 RepID=A0A0B5L589_9POLY|nr:VP1 [Meles meles polyomavirus 1]AJG44388.1 VP1 [Meles meles polyomavirus 1]